MSDFAVELIDVSKTFPGDTVAEKEVEALHQISLTIKEGEFFTLLGPSGCGKTTTLRLVAGFESPTQGQIFVKGKLMNAFPPYLRPVNTVFQRYALFPHLTVAQNVAFGLVSKKIPKNEQKRMVAEMLQLVQLPDVENRKPAHLSGGQQQRVALARALVNQPEVLLLDEPLSSLDLKLRKQMQLELKRLQAKTGITFVYVTHDQEEALTMSDRIAVMSQGSVLQIGSPREIYEKPKNEFVASFIGESNFLQGRVENTANNLIDIRLWNDQVIHLPVNGIRPSAGQLAKLAIRPEKMQLSSNGSLSPKLDVEMSGTIAETVYAGENTQYLVVLNSGEQLKIHVINADGMENGELLRGDAVHIRCASCDLRMVAVN